MPVLHDSKAKCNRNRFHLHDGKKYKKKQTKNPKKTRPNDLNVIDAVRSLELGLPNLYEWLRTRQVRNLRIGGGSAACGSVGRGLYADLHVRLDISLELLLDVSSHRMSDPSPHSNGCCRAVQCLVIEKKDFHPTQVMV